MKLFNWFKKDKKSILNFGKAICPVLILAKNNLEQIVAFDTETTGLNYRTDVILSIGAVGIYENTIGVSDYLELFLIQDIFKKKQCLFMEF
jgi:DNA polymerase-3 subunit epsilon